jgi:putative nucleotidyltransferase with HDIG domain
MISAQILFAFSIINFFFFLGSLFLYLKNTKRNDFLHAALFFLCSTLAIFGERNILLGYVPQQLIIWHKVVYVAIFGYILIFPLFVSALTRRPIIRSVKYILLGITLGCIAMAIFSDRIISNDVFSYGGAFRPHKGTLYPLFISILLVIPGYFFARLIMDMWHKKTGQNYIPLCVGIGVGFMLAIMDVMGIFQGKPLIPWLRNPYVIAIFIVSLSFTWTFLSQYSWVFATLTRSQHEIERLVEKSNRDFVEFVQLIAKTLDAKDKYTAGHSLRVMDYAVKIAHALQLPANEIDLLKQACLLHDIGKISIPDGILNKKKKLTPKERKYILKHPVVGKKILSTVSEFKEILDIIYTHHERVDGRGYPDGRMKDDIPFLARILAVADSYDAMRSERPYRPARNKDQAIEELILAKGSQLDAEVVDIFIKAISSVSSI